MSEVGPETTDRNMIAILQKMASSDDWPVAPTCGSGDACHCGMLRPEIPNNREMKSYQETRQHQTRTCLNASFVENCCPWRSC